MLRPFWQRKPVWLRVVLFTPTVPAVVLGALMWVLWDALPEIWEAILVGYEELLVTPRSDR